MNHRQHKYSVVLGGAGFIGSHLCHRLLSDGHKVLCVDNLSTGFIDNIAMMLDCPAFRFVHHDITAPFTRSTLETEHVDEIYNLACPASPLHYQRDPTRTLSTSIIGSANALALATECGAKILLASTSEVYGNPTISPQSESYWGNVNPNGIRSCYDEGKRAAETLFCDHHRQFGTDTRIIRIFNTYGPKMAPDDGRVIPTFLRQALSGEPLTINGDGMQTRSFMYIDDLLDGVLRVMKADIPALPVNLGNPEEISVNELAATILSITKSDSTIVHRPMPPDDPRHRRPDISRAHSLLDGWEPRISLDKGLKLTIKSLR